MSPTVTFHDNDDCLQRRYDLVLASSSLQYSQHWRTHLHHLAGATLNSLLLTRVPLVESHPSFVVIQRAQAYGYATEYLGWVFNRSELLEEATAAGLKLEREFLPPRPHAHHRRTRTANPRRISLHARRRGSRSPPFPQPRGRRERGVMRGQPGQRPHGRDVLSAGLVRRDDVWCGSAGAGQQFERRERNQGPFQGAEASSS